MKSSETKNLISIARLICEESGSKLTEKRQHVLEVLFQLNTPVSAYELTDHYNSIIGAPITAMSVYRILEFLEAAKLVHRLNSINKYIICAPTFGPWKHQPPLFLICKSCQSIKKIELANDLIKTLSEQAKSAGFPILGSQIELNSICNDCSSQKHKKNSSGGLSI
ncbi:MULTISPECIES: Fur family transcriptional regulator [Alteromonadaceae]|uniref:Fur family transcriptional regulator n=1 Tax=Alteromonadaceae TaxID=72275 RepID=UPI001C0A18AE|nr:MULTISPECIES: transcriptional repressor [Aliiglaciecola]MBU2878386.1 transcriptional repressor [Aliiglaciecola lipolytica]MDO6711714.1 transcriptional repressor [Aliiglaciecola sp. 2_MG-2023]MDO6752785.1 transcriptional repressor [Aliiglaciecola sp. 1_MG-2023]